MMLRKIASLGAAASGILTAVFALVQHRRTGRFAGGMGLPYLFEAGSILEPDDLAAFRAGLVVSATLLAVSVLAHHVYLFNWTRSTSLVTSHFLSIPLGLMAAASLVVLGFFDAFAFRLLHEAAKLCFVLGLGGYVVLQDNVYGALSMADYGEPNHQHKHAFGSGARRRLVLVFVLALLAVLYALVLPGVRVAVHGSLESGRRVLASECESLVGDLSLCARAVSRSQDVPKRTVLLDFSDAPGLAFAESVRAASETAMLIVGLLFVGLQAGGPTSPHGAPHARRQVHM